MNPRFGLPISSSAPSVRRASGDSLDPLATGPGAFEAETPFAGVLVEPAERDHTHTRNETVFVPESYEPSYAYPLLLWIDPAPVSGRRLVERMNQISDRNYLGLSLAMNSDTPPDVAADLIQQCVGRLRRQFHVHTERVILAGAGVCGTLALEVALRHPGLFGGVVALGGKAPQSPRLLASFAALRGFRVLLGLPTTIREVTSLRQLERTLWTAGVEVAVWQSGSATSGEMLRQIDYWVMAGVERETAVWV